MDTRKISFTKLTLATAIAAAGSAAVPVAIAEDLGLEEITVTAQKREQSLQEIPIAVSAFNTQQLEELNVTSLDDLNGQVPSFQAPPFAASTATPTIYIRGMGNVGVQTTKDGAVGVYLDGVALGRATGLSLDVADLERIEILRGPQGTLYGRNTTAGAINYITRKPHDEWGFKQRFTVGNYNHWASQTDLNIPVTDNFFMKLGYMATAKDGWVENQNTTLPDQVDPNQEKNQAATIALRWQTTDNFTIDYAYDWSDMDYGNGWYQTIAAPADNTGSAGTGTDKRLDEAQLAKGMEESNVNAQGHNLTLTWDLNAVTLKSITGYRELESNLWQNYLDGVAFPLQPNEFVQTWPLEQDQFSQEFQVIGAALDGGLEYVAGLYYFEENANESKISDFGAPGFPFLDSYNMDAEAKSTAVYGQATWRPNILDQRLGFTLGLRYTEDERKATKTFVDTGLLGPTAPTEPVNGDVDNSNTSGQLVIDYAFTDNVNSYFKYATGYRSGGFNADGKPGNFELGFDPEDVQSTELGLKSSLWDQRITLNFAGYYNQYTDLQVDAFEPPVFSRTDNVGASTIKGVEVEWAMRLTQGLTFDGFYAYMDAEFDEYLLPDGTDVADLRAVPNAPEQQTKLGLEYAFPMTSFGQLTARLDYLWQDEFWSNPDLVNQNDAYGIWNGRVQLIGVPLPKGEIRVALWGKNLSDEEYTVLTTAFGPETAGAMFGQPRTYGMDFIYEF